MRLLAPFRPTRTLVTPAILRRGGVLGTLALAERLLTAASAWVLFARPLEEKVAVTVALGVVFTVRTFLRQALASRTEADLLDRVIVSLLDGDVLRASVLQAEDAQADLGQGVYLTAQRLSEALPSLAADLAAAVCFAVVVCLVEPVRLVLAAISLTAIPALGLVWSSGRLHRAVRVSWELRDRVVDKLVDALEGRLEIVASGERAPFVADAHERARAWGLANARAAAARVMSGRLPILALASLVAALIAVDSQWLRGLSATLADVALLASVTPAFAGVAQGSVALVETEHMALLVSQVIGGAQPQQQGNPPPAVYVPVVFDAVSFRYDGSAANALNEASFAWGEERVLALSGANGSGKSTCLRLLLALGRPQAGTVRVGGSDLKDIQADAWRGRVAFLPQRPYLPMRATVAAAVRLLAPQASDTRILTALERVGVLEGLRRAGPDALGVSVDGLSVGQRQRVALARLLCRDASLFVLDEPDANLDQAGIALVAELVADLSKEGRVILAAHTQELLDTADRVVVLDAGRVARDGPH